MLDLGHVGGARRARVAQAARYAGQAVRGAAEVAFRTVFDPIRTAAERARVANVAGHTATPADVAAAERARAVADAAAAEGAQHDRWRVGRLPHHLASAPTTA